MENSEYIEELEQMQGELTKLGRKIKETKNTIRILTNKVKSQPQENYETKKDLKEEEDLLDKYKEDLLIIQNRFEFIKNNISHGRSK